MVSWMVYLDASLSISVFLSLTQDYLSDAARSLWWLSLSDRNWATQITDEYFTADNKG